MFERICSPIYSEGIALTQGSQTRVDRRARCTSGRQYGYRTRLISKVALEMDSVIENHLSEILCKCRRFLFISVDREIRGRSLCMGASVIVGETGCRFEYRLRK